MKDSERVSLTER